MRALLLLALAAFVESCGPADAAPIGAFFPRGCRDRSCIRAPRVGGEAAPLAPFQLFTEYDFVGEQRMPAVGSTGLLALCRVASSGTAWECVNGQTGASFGTVTQGTGTTYQDTPFGVKAMSDVTSAKAPKVVSTSLDSLFKADHTIVMGGYSTTLTDATYQHWFGATDGTNTMYIRREGSALHCAWDGAGGNRTANNGTLDTINAWTVTSCRRSGNNHIGRTNGFDTVTVAGASISGDFTAGTEFYFGERQAAGHGFPLRGPFAWAAFYNVALTDAQLKVIERRWWGVDSRVTATLATGIYCLDPDAGQVDCYQRGGAMVGPNGLRAVRATTMNNKFAADALAATGGTDVGTPTITPTASAGNFFRWRNTNECALVVDNDAAAFEGKQGADFYLRDGYQTASFYAAAGTSGTTTDKLRIKIDVTGGGWADAGTSHICDVSGMTSAVVRRNCTSPFFIADAGSPTVKASYLVGNAVADTGSVTMCHRQTTAAGWKQEPIIDNAAKGETEITLNPTADSWPATSLGGKYEVVFTPVYSTLTDWSDADDTLYLFDSYDADPNHVVVMIFGYQLPGAALMSVEAGDGATWTRITIGELPLVPYQRYATSTEWRPTGLGTCDISWRFDACSGAAADCTATTVLGSAGGGVCPTQPTEVRLGKRYSGAYATDVFVSAVRVYSL